MTRILIRTGKAPNTPVSAEFTLAQDVFNSNTGNFLFQHAVWESLAIEGTELTANSTLPERREAGAPDAAAINEQFDHFVVPLANAFRPDFVKQLDRLSSLVEQLTIPVSIVGVGAQAPASMKLDDLAPVRESTQRLVTAVLDRSPSIGVRGEFTRNFLLDLGFGDEHVDIIGCPSLFRRGSDFAVSKKQGGLTAEANLALNLTPEVRGIGQFSLDQAARYPNLTYIAQDAHDLRLLLWGIPRPNVNDLNAPVHIDHPLYRDGRMQVFLDQWTWFEDLAQRDFVYGTRFHGNVAALMAGTPAMLLAHDSRTLELAEYHQMPHMVVTEFTQGFSAEELFERTDLAGFNHVMPENFERYTNFLDRHELAHKWQPNAQAIDFDAYVSQASFPPPATPVTAGGVTEVLSRVNWLREGAVFDITRHPARYEYPFEHPTHTGFGRQYARFERLQREAHARHTKSIDQLQSRLEKLDARANRLTSRVEQLEQRTFRGRLGLVKRRILKMFNR